MQDGTPRFGSIGISNLGKGAILLLDLPITVGCTGRVLTIRTAAGQNRKESTFECLPRSGHSPAALNLADLLWSQAGSQGERTNAVKYIRPVIRRSCRLIRVRRHFHGFPMLDLR